MSIDCEIGCFSCQLSSWSCPSFDKNEWNISYVVYCKQYNILVLSNMCVMIHTKFRKTITNKNWIFFKLNLYRDTDIVNVKVWFVRPSIRLLYDYYTTTIPTAFQTIYFKKNAIMHELNFFFYKMKGFHFYESETWPLTLWGKMSSRWLRVGRFGRQLGLIVGSQSKLEEFLNVTSYNVSYSWSKNSGEKNQ
jgi:hypothetical protein